MHPAHRPDYRYIHALLEHGEDYAPQPGDVVTMEEEEIESATVLACDVEGTLRLRLADGTVQAFSPDPYTWIDFEESPFLSNIFEQHLRRADPDGVAWSDDQVEPELAARLRAGVDRLCARESIDYHPGSGERVRDLVHPSLYPYIKGRSPIDGSMGRAIPPVRDRFGRPYESSDYQWLPTPFRIDPDGRARPLAYLNNLDGQAHPDLVDALSELLSASLPLLESVLGFVHETRFWHDGLDSHEGELPESRGPIGPAEAVSLRGRELLIIPKIVEYRLRAGETHEGVWHVEGMSHEHIVATCVYVLDRDEALCGGELRFKRAYTLEEAGALFWRIDQCRPRPIEELVDQGVIPVGSLATPAGRLLVFPNSHIHKLSQLSVAEGAPEATRRVIVFWLVDPDVSIPSTREVPAQQGVLPHTEALAVRLRLMEERKRHKQTLNVRAVSLCEH